tara:strand:+ start:4450 stop:5307 length:858 start_codon:yes stop_codon:yes gene_type:complete
MTLDGKNCGGVVGFLNCLKSYVNKFKPDGIFVCWDGANGSVRKRAIFPDYKQNRRPFFIKDPSSSESDNKLWQLQKLVEYLKFFPVCQIYIDNCEADDVIYYLTEKFKKIKKIITTSDQDMYQLIDENTNVYSLSRKQIINENFIIENYNVSPENFAFYKSFIGDPSDNIKGLKGIGQKKFNKFFPFMKDRHAYSIKEFKEKNEKNKDNKLKFNDYETLEKNLKLITLDYNQLSLNQIDNINNSISNFIHKLSILNFRKKLIEDRINIRYIDNIISAFKHLIRGK